MACKHEKVYYSTQARVGFYMCAQCNEEVPSLLMVDRLDREVKELKKRIEVLERYLPTPEEA